VGRAGATGPSPGAGGEARTCVGRASSSGARSRLSPLSGEASRYRTVKLRRGAAPAPQIRGRASLDYGKGPEGSPGAARCPRGVLRGRERSRVLWLWATDVLHEGAQARRGDDRARRLATGEGLPGGRHGLGEQAFCRLAPSSCLRFWATPLLFSGHVPRPMLRGRPGACRGTLPGRRHASVWVSI